MASSGNGNVCIAGNSTEGRIEVKLVAKFYKRFMHHCWAIRMLVQQQKPCMNLRISWASQPFVWQTHETKKR